MVWFYRDTPPVAYQAITKLSIPLWSDFIIAVERLEKYLKKNFQSHYGLILSSFNKLSVHYYNELSIPLWSDFILHISFNRFSILDFFQSHYGLILSGQKVLIFTMFSTTFNPTMVWFYQVKEVIEKIKELELSIPLWSDFIVRPFTKKIFCHKPFNPTMVWFYRRFGFGSRRVSRLSIPLWSDFIINTKIK